MNMYLTEIKSVTLIKLKTFLSYGIDQRLEAKQYTKLRCKMPKGKYAMKRPEKRARKIQNMYICEEQLKK